MLKLLKIYILILDYFVGPFLNSVKKWYVSNQEFFQDPTFYVNLKQTNRYFKAFITYPNI